MELPAAPHAAAEDRSSEHVEQSHNRLRSWSMFRKVKELSATIEKAEGDEADAVKEVRRPPVCPT
jgi:hypothetical protein